MWYWYVQRDDELLLDLDRTSTRKLASFCARLDGAIADGLLDVTQWRLTPSTSEQSLHAYIQLGSPVSDMEKAAWEIYLLSDRFRAACGLMRRARLERWPSLLIEPYPLPSWRPADRVCSCTEKHDREGYSHCPLAMAEGRRLDGYALFGRPRTEGWMDQLKEGVKA